MKEKVQKNDRVFPGREGHSNGFLARIYTDADYTGELDFQEDPIYWSEDLPTRTPIGGEDASYWDLSPDERRTVRRGENEVSLEDSLAKARRDGIRRKLMAGKMRKAQERRG